MGCYTDEYTESLEAELDRLKAENERLRKALRPFAESEKFVVMEPEHYRAAKAAYEQSGKTDD